jgi:hypothetical protein
MAVGTSTYLANAWLNAIRGNAAGTTYTAPSAIYMQLHTNGGSNLGPGSAGTSNVSGYGTRKAATFSASTTGTLSLTSTVVFDTWPSGATGETIAHVAFFDAATGGNFLWSATLSAAKTMSTNDTLNVTGASLTITPAS